MSKTTEKPVIEPKPEAKNEIAPTTPPPVPTAAEMVIARGERRPLFRNEDLAHMQEWIVKNRIAIGCVALALLILWWVWPRGHQPVTNGNGALYVQSGFAPSYQQPASGTPAIAAPSFGTESFVVAKATRSAQGVWLNSMSDYKTPGNRSIFLSGDASRMDEKALLARRVTASGQWATGKSGQFLKATNPSAIKVE